MPSHRKRKLFGLKEDLVSVSTDGVAIEEKVNSRECEVCRNWILKHAVNFLYLINSVQRQRLRIFSTKSEGYVFCCVSYEVFGCDLECILKNQGVS